MGMAFRRRKPRTHNGIIKRGRYLAHTAARFFNQHAVPVCAGRLVSLLLRPVSSGEIKGKFLTRLQNPAVDRFHRQTNILIPVFIACRLRRKASDNLILLLCLRRAAFRGALRKFRFHRSIISSFYRLHQALYQRIFIQRSSSFRLRIGIGACFLIKGDKLGIGRRTVPFTGKLLSQRTEGLLQRIHIETECSSFHLPVSVNLIQNSPDCSAGFLLRRHGLILPDHRQPLRLLQKKLLGVAPALSGNINPLDDCAFVSRYRPCQMFRHRGRAALFHCGFRPSAARSPSKSQTCRSKNRSQ